MIASRIADVAGLSIVDVDNAYSCSKGILSNALHYFFLLLFIIQSFAFCTKTFLLVNELYTFNNAGCVMQPNKFS